MLNKLSTLLCVSLCFGLTACGGSSKKGDAEAADERSSIEKLEAMSSELQAEADAVMKPIDEMDGILNQLTELPTKYKLTPADFKAIAQGIIDGGELKMPPSMDAKAAADISAFAGRFRTMMSDLKATPDRAASLIATVAAALVEVPVLATKVGAETALVTANPFASAEDKAKAKSDADRVKAVQEATMAKVQEIQTKVTELPGRATQALTKFGQAMAKVGLSAATDAASGAVNDAKGAAADSAKAAGDSAKDAAESAVE